MFVRIFITQNASEKMHFINCCGVRGCETPSQDCTKHSCFVQRTVSVRNGIESRITKSIAPSMHKRLSALDPKNSGYSLFFRYSDQWRACGRSIPGPAYTNNKKTSLDWSFFYLLRGPESNRGLEVLFVPTISSRNGLYHAPHTNCMRSSPL